MTTQFFDFVIIGGGTAGLVLANRLSEHPSQRVLVLEAGSDLTGDLRIITPAFFQILLGSRTDWGFESEPQLNLEGRRIALNQGKALGGSSAINSHVFVPPSKGLIDAWESLGNDGWNWDTLQQYYARAYTSPYVDEASKQTLGINGWASRNNSSGGPIQASFSGDSSHPIREAWAEAFKSCGYSMPTDPFLGASVGGFSTLASIHPETKERSYAASAYYSPIKHRTNLYVHTNAVVEKILIDGGGQQPRAYGVLYKEHNKTKTAIAAKEVILAAGALQSPKLLELSGIGNAKLLEKQKIQVVQDLPQVGENLHDHLGCYISYEAADDTDTLDDLVRHDPEALGKAMKEYAADRSGMLGSLGVHTYAYMPLVQCLSGEGHDTLKELLNQHRPASGKQPDQARAKTYYDIVEKTLLNSKEPSGTFLAALSQPPVPIEPNSSSTGPLKGKFITLSVMLSQPLSRGSVHINSDQISTPPVVNPNYLSNPIDLEVYARHVQYVETIATSPAFSRLLKQPLRRSDPSFDIGDLSQVKDFIQSNAVSAWHVCGSCAMLPREKGGVVDTQLGVYGVENLRIVDASAIPLISTASLQTTVYAFAERAADLIKGIHGLK
ncbi:putative GMC oxidoreductase [Annulohypoxylon bovei var. microspora]|nr:putative GMC oxidoreductase [Annulohypoxylon bovei var. microspora]